jgi:hypothetical protein
MPLILTVIFRQFFVAKHLEMVILKFVSPTLPCLSSYFLAVY